jgi:hypothetical protein
VSGYLKFNDAVVAGVLVGGSTRLVTLTKVKKICL